MALLTIGDTPPLEGRANVLADCTAEVKDAAAVPVERLDVGMFAVSLTEGPTEGPTAVGEESVVTLLAMVMMPGGGSYPMPAPPLFSPGKATGGSLAVEVTTLEEELVVVLVSTVMIPGGGSYPMPPPPLFSPGKTTGGSLAVEVTTLEELVVVLEANVIKSGGGSYPMPPPPLFSPGKVTGGSSPASSCPATLMTCIAAQRLSVSILTSM